MHRLITKADRLAARWRPKNSTAVPHPRGESVAVVFTSEEESRLTPGKILHCAVAYRGTAGRSEFNYSYNKPEQRTEKIKEFFDSCDRNAQWRAERIAARKAETSPFSQPSTGNAVQLDTAATAQELRRTLSQVFPNTKFSVRSSLYSMGSSIDVRWTDGPTHKQVDAVMDCFENCGFDGMQDMKTYRAACQWRGHRVQWGADYVHGSRSESFETLKIAAREVALECDLPLLEISQEGGYPHVRMTGQAVPWCTYVMENGETGFAHNSHRNESYDQLIYQYAHSLSFEQPQPVALPERITKKEEEPTSCCIADHCGSPFKLSAPDSRDRSTFRAFWQRYCPKHRLAAEPVQPIIGQPSQPQPGSEEYEELRRKIELIMRIAPPSRVVN